MNNSNNISFDWKYRKLDNTLSSSNIKVLVLHHGPCERDERNEIPSFWTNLEISGKEYASNNNMTITFKGFNSNVSEMIKYLDQFNNEKLYKNYDAIISTVLNSSTYGELNPDYNGELKDVTISSKLNIIGRAIPLFTFNTVSEKIDSAIKYIGNGKIGEEKMGKKLAIMAAKYAIDAVNMNNVLKFNSRTLQDEAFVAIVKDVTETIDLDGDGKLESEEIKEKDEEEIVRIKIEENKIKQLITDPNFDINLLENMTKDNQIFNFFRNYANKLFDEIIIYASEENNSAFNSRINGIKRIFKEEKIKIFYKIDDIDKEINPINKNKGLFSLKELDSQTESAREVNYGLFSLQEQNLDKMLVLIDDLKGMDINILSFGICDLDEVIEKDVEYSFISAASGTKPNEQINNVLSSVKDFISKLKTNKRSFVRNLHNKTSRAISETTTTGQSLYNIDTSNRQLISLDSMRESLNLNVINNISKQFLDYIDEQYITNVELVNKLFSGIAFKSSSNNGQGYTIKIPTKYNCDIKDIIDNIVNGYIKAFNYIFSYKEDWNTENDNELKYKLNKIHSGVSFKDYFDIEFIIHNAEELGFTHSEIAEQNIQNKDGIIDDSKIFSFYHLFNNTSGINEQDKIDKYLAIPLVKDVINYLNEICKGIAIVRLGVPLGKARKFDKDDRDALYYNRGTRGKCAWCNAVKSAFNTAVNETVNVVKNPDDYFNEAIKFMDEQVINIWNKIGISPCDLLHPSNIALRLLRNPDAFMKLIPEDYRGTIQQESGNICFIFGATGNFTLTYYKTTNIEDLLKTGEIVLAKANEEIYHPPQNWLPTTVKYFSPNFLNIDFDVNKGSGFPTSNFWGPLKSFFDFGITKIKLHASPIKYYVSTGGEISSGGATLNTEVGFYFPEGGAIDIQYRYKTTGKKIRRTWARGGKDRYYGGSQNMRRNPNPFMVIPVGSKGSYNSKNEFRLVLATSKEGFAEYFKLDTTDILSLLNIKKEDKENLKELLDKVNFGVEFYLQVTFTMQPFVALQLPTSTEESKLFCGVTIPNSSFEISRFNFTIPEWAKKIPGFGGKVGNNTDRYILDCIENTLEDFSSFTIPCFEVNSA